MSVYKNEKRGTWYAILRHKDPDGASRQKKKEGFRTKRDALEWERNFLIEHSGDACLCKRCSRREICERRTSTV